MALATTLDPTVGVKEAEALGLEPLSMPLHDVNIFLVTGIAHNFYEVRETRYPSHIFRGSRERTFKTKGLFQSSRHVLGGFNFNDVNPVITKVADPSYGFDCPNALAFDGTHIWVANKLNSSLTQIDASTGNWIQTVTGTDLVNPDALAIAGSNIWVADSGSGGAFEYSAPTGAYLRSTGPGGGGSDATSCVSYHNGHIWISSSNTGTVLEFNATSGAYVRETKIFNPEQLIFTGRDLFVVRVTPVTALIEYNAAGVYARTIVNLGYKLQNGMAILNVGSNLWGRMEPIVR